MRSVVAPAVQTPIGTLQFSDGAPTAEIAARVYDRLDFRCSWRRVAALAIGRPAARRQRSLAGVSDPARVMAIGAK